MLEILPCSFFVIPSRQLHRDEDESTLGCLISSTVAAHCKMISGISRKAHGLVQWYPSQQICVQEITCSYLGWCRGTHLSRYVFRRSLVHIQVGVVVLISVDMCSEVHWFVLSLVQWYPSQQICVQEITGSCLGWCSGTYISRYVFRRSLVHIQVGVVVAISVGMCSGNHWFIFRFVYWYISQQICVQEIIGSYVGWFSGNIRSRLVFKRSHLLISVGS